MLVGILRTDFFHSTQDLCMNRLLKVNYGRGLVFPQEPPAIINWVVKSLREQPKFPNFSYKNYLCRPNLSKNRDLH